MNSWGTNFIIINDVHQRLSKDYPNWEHWATIKRGLDEYIVFHCATPTNPLEAKFAGNTYIEKVVRDRANLELKQITDPNEFIDIEAFCRDAGLLHKDSDTELKVGYWFDEAPA